MKPIWEFGSASAAGGYFDDDGHFHRVVEWSGNTLDDLKEPEGQDFEDKEKPA